MIIYYFLNWVTFGQYDANPHELTLLWRRPLSYRNQSIDLQSKSIDWFPHDSGLRHEIVKHTFWNNSFAKDRYSWKVVSCKNGVLKNFAKLSGKHLRQSLFFDKFHALSLLTLAHPTSGQRQWNFFINSQFFSVFFKYHEEKYASNLGFLKVH